MDIIFPPVSFYFHVKFTDISDQIFDASFQSVSGLAIDIQTDIVKEGGENRFEHVIPVRTKYQNLVLKRGVVTNSKLIDWCLGTFQSMEIRPTNLIISLLNEIHQPLMSWNVINAWPKKWSVEDLNAMESKVLIESLELQYQMFSVIKR